MKSLNPTLLQATELLNQLNEVTTNYSQQIVDEYAG